MQTSGPFTVDSTGESLALLPGALATASADMGPSLLRGFAHFGGRLTKRFGAASDSHSPPPFMGQITDSQQFRSLAGGGHDLSHADLRGLRLESSEDVLLAVRVGASLRGVRLPVQAALQGASLAEANLRGADLTAADLRGANLAGAKLCWADLTGADLRGASLAGADLQGARLEGANLREANLEGANLGLARVRSARLGLANLRGARLVSARLGDADLSGADLTAAELRGADLSGANLGCTQLARANGLDAERLGTELRSALRSRSSPGSLAGAQLSLDGDLALRFILQEEDLSSTRWPETAGRAVVDRFLAPLSQGLAGALRDGPASGDFLERRCNHWKYGRSVLTSIDSIGAESAGLKVAMMQEVCTSLAARSDAELTPVAGPLLEVLTRNSLYLWPHPGLLSRLVRAAVVDAADRVLRVDFLARSRTVLCAVGGQILKELNTETGREFAAAGNKAIQRVLYTLEKLMPAEDPFKAPSRNKARDLQRGYQRQLVLDLRAAYERRVRHESRRQPPEAVPGVVRRAPTLATYPWSARAKRTPARNRFDSLLALAAQSG